MCPIWNGLAMLGDENSTITVFPSPTLDLPYSHPREITSETTFRTNASLQINIFTYALTCSTLSKIDSFSIDDATSAAIICGAFLIVFANLKQGNAKSPFLGSVGTSIISAISSAVNPISCLAIICAICTL